ncbi:Alpha-amylase 1 [Aeoliella mucimassa]|uniref:Alpha-amylase 1 n=2 Tax=Aeoliella mucimassa TaxID=2527972 RepID=A0A518AIB2_9BACT|nr:Alpha-amylase 1 [Aeoliella mucimassa]
MEQAYQDSYLPFLEVFEPYESLRLAIHTSGSLIEWLEKAHPEYLDRLAALVAADRLEIVGGAFFEPILTMIPPRDRVGQISSYTEWLNNRLGADVQGMWMPERVWEQSLTSDVATAGIRYTILDDFHFKCAGWTEDQLHGYYLTENNGQLLCVFPGSEKMRYTLPFAEPQETIDYLRHVASIQPNAIVTFGDDGEKFGTWPDTKAHVYEHGWLRRFFDTLVANQDWIHVTTPSEAISSVAPLGKIYIPESSYREMTEWALPAEQQNNYEDTHHHLEEVGEWEGIKPFVRGGFWRNFKARYPETDEMYSRMLEISNRLESLIRQGQQGSDLDQARIELYRGQCNCSYWHGAFGGVYLPHLRNAVYNHLIAAENLLDRHEGNLRSDQEWGSIDAADYNSDGRQEVRLASDSLIAYAAPAAGGSLYELDVRNICHNLLATLARRPEAYHRKVLAGPSAAGGEVASIHDRVVFKQEGLDKEVSVYDDYLRKSLIDHFYDLDVTLDAVATNEYREQGDFVGGAYEAKLRRSAEKNQVLLTRDGHVDGTPIRITKGITLATGGSELEIAYLLEGLPNDQPLHFGIELNFAGLPAGADDRFFHTGDGNSMGDLGQRLDLIDVQSLNLTDSWLGIDCGLTLDRPTSIWTHPIATVSQSEGGFELVHQSVMVLPHWMVQADEQGRWSVKLRLAIDTSLAESRMNETACAVAE